MNIQIKIDQISVATQGFSQNDAHQLAYQIGMEALNNRVHSVNLQRIQVDPNQVGGARSVQPSKGTRLASAIVRSIKSGGTP